MINFTVGISVFNEEANIKNLVDSLLKEDIPEIIIYSDGSTDKTNNILRNYSKPNLKVYFSNVNKGFNEGFKYIFDNAKNDIIVNIDGDSLPLKDTIFRLVKAFEEDDNLGICSGTHFFYHKSNNIIDRLNSRLYTCKKILDEYNYKIGEFTHINGLIYAYRRSVVKREYIKSQNLDVYLGYKILNLAYNTRFIKEAKSLFSPPSTVRDYISNRDRVIKGHYLLCYYYKIRNYLWHETDFKTYVINILRADTLTPLNLLSLIFGLIIDGYYRVKWLKIKYDPTSYINREHTWKYLKSTKKVMKIRC